MLFPITLGLIYEEAAAPMIKEKSIERCFNAVLPAWAFFSKAHFCNATDMFFTCPVQNVVAIEILSA